MFTLYRSIFEACTKLQIKQSTEAGGEEMLPNICESVGYTHCATDKKEDKY